MFRGVAEWDGEGWDCVHRHVDLLKITVHHLQKHFLDDGWGWQNGGGEVRG